MLRMFVGREKLIHFCAGTLLPSAWQPQTTTHQRERVTHRESRGGINLVKQRAGRLGATARCGPPRILRLDELSPEQRHLVLALIEAAKAEPVDEKAAA
jgi:hypothetical protein